MLLKKPKKRKKWGRKARDIYSAETSTNEKIMMTQTKRDLGLHIFEIVKNCWI